MNLLIDEKDRLINKLKIEIENLTKISIEFKNLQSQLADLIAQLQAEKAEKDRLTSKYDNLTKTIGEL